MQKFSCNKNHNMDATKNSVQLRHSYLKIDIFSESCGCNKIKVDAENCNGQDIAQIIVYLASTLAPFVGAESSSDILMDLSNRSDVKSNNLTSKGSSNV